MKSAYELAMERLAAKEPVVQLSADQKQRISAIEAKCKADIAAKELLLQSELAKTLATGARDEAAKIQGQLTDEIRRFEEKRERAKDAVRGETSPER